MLELDEGYQRLAVAEIRVTYIQGSRLEVPTLQYGLEQSPSLLFDVCST